MLAGEPGVWPVDRLTDEDQRMLWPDEIWPQEIGALAVLDGGLASLGGRGRVEAVREVIAARLRLVPRFRQLLYVPRPGLGRPLWVDAPAWLDRLETEYGNLGAAMSWLVEQDQLEPAIQLSWATWRFWWLRGHAEELASYVDILPKSEHLPPRQRALALSGTGFGLFASGDQATAQPLLEQSLPLYRQAGDMLGAATTAAIWVTSWHCSTRTRGPASCSNRRSPRCRRPATTGSPDPSVCSICWTWRSCAISSARSGSARPITTAQRNCSPRP
jgi:hypothetical protein